MDIISRLFVLMSILCASCAFLPSSKLLATRQVFQDTSQQSQLFANNKVPRKIASYDNVGDPIYEDELEAGRSNGMNVLGINIDLDPVSLSGLIFGLIAFNFFVLANL
jgi:hypothetical protein